MIKLALGVFSYFWLITFKGGHLEWQGVHFLLDMM